jgi:hypothetical protein
VSQDVEVSRQVKAAFLFNFAKFVEWPSAAFANRTDPFTFCISGEPLHRALDGTVRGETISSRRIVVRRLNTEDPVRGCQILYTGGPASVDVALLRAAAGVPVLTVGESTDFIRSGGMIRFTENARRIRFEINPDAAERVSLRLSSRLLRLAEIVRPNGD